MRWLRSLLTNTVVVCVVFESPFFAIFSGYLVQHEERRLDPPQQHVFRGRILSMIAKKKFGFPASG